MPASVLLLFVLAAPASAGDGPPPDPFRSASHRDTAFVPTYRATAYSESNTYRTDPDPYAVGAITHPSPSDDNGGKTYGTYQFESYVYRDGTVKSAPAVSGSTVSRFVHWSDNPYGARLLAAVEGSGAASEAFDTVWRSLAEQDNAAFGRAQERFLEHDVGAAVDAFFDAAAVPDTLRRDPDLYDVAIGTLNQYGSLADGMAAQLAEVLAKTPAPTAAAVGAALQEIKRARVSSHFKSSPGAWNGINVRIDREQALFER